MTINYLPLAEKMRPKTLDLFVGQKHLVGEKGPLFLSIEQKKPLSVLFWGPPGCGKTTLARLYAKSFDARLLTLSAVSSGVTDLKKIIHETESAPLFHKTLFLFIDEIHRYNKAQQDLILPYLEKGTFLLIGATTENPSFSLNNALLSRLRVMTFHTLEEKELETILQNYEACQNPLKLSPASRKYLIEIAQGDGRYLLNMVEGLQHIEKKTPLEIDDLKQVLQQRASLFDKSGDGHYNLISALHKSVRGSDPDASLYWFCRMIDSGEDPLFIARRLVRMASEDVGLADPQALHQAVLARQTYEHLGSPEGELALAQAVIYLALAPKSNAVYTAYKSCMQLAAKTGQKPPPETILNAPTKLMKEQGYGKDYLYDHNTPNGFSGQNYFPKDLPPQKFYFPVERGFEREMKKRTTYFEKLRESLKNQGDCKKIL